jgi:hypothetical protein
MFRFLHVKEHVKERHPSAANPTKDPEKDAISPGGAS